MQRLGFLYLTQGKFRKAREVVNVGIELAQEYGEPWAVSGYHSGDVEKAKEEYERITSLTDGRLTIGDIYAKSFYKLGEIYEEQGDKSKAIENYEKFLDLWKDADPGIVEVEDAKKRLAGLKSQ